MQLRQVGPETLLARTLMASLSDALRPLSTRQHTSAYASLSHAVKQPRSERERQEEEHATEAVGGGGCGGVGYESAAGGGAALSLQVAYCLFKGMCLMSLHRH